jgi:ankyrin repeat protein
MNKYNVRAIRNDLDDCFRSASWKNFRSKFQTMENDKELCHAVITCQPHKKGKVGRMRKNMKGSLLHSLCGINTKPHPVPTDIIEAIATVVPKALYAQDENGRTPLHKAIYQGGRLDIIECLLELDKTKQSLLIVDKNGDTPLLLAVRSNEDSAENIVYLLLHHDVSKLSLLIEGGRKKKRAPIWYVASKELRSMGDQEEELPDELRCILLHTFQAIQGRTNTQPIMDDPLTQILYAGAGWDEDLIDDDDDATSSTLFDIESQSQDIPLLLRAMIACTHLLEKQMSKLFEFMLRRDTYRRVFLSPEADEDGNLMLHHVCMAKVPQFDQKLNLDRKKATTNLIAFLIQQTPTMVKHANAQGDLPLHLAIQTGKVWDHIESLTTAYPEALRHCNLRGELPLHVAIKYSLGSHDDGMMQAVKMLWKLYPEAAVVQDASTRLYPFQLVACQEWHASKSKCKQQAPPPESARHDETQDEDDESSKGPEAERLTLIYTFLLESPQVLQLFLPSQISIL